MAKRKRAPHEKPFSRPMPKAEADTAVADSSDTLSSDTLSSDTSPTDSSPADSNQAEPQNKMADQDVAEQADTETEVAETVAADQTPAEQTVAAQTTDEQTTSEQSEDVTTEVSSSESSESTDAGEETSTDSVAFEKADTNSEVVVEFVGKWNRLITTTNWEKGKIICEWRDALIATNAAVTDYSDEAWSQVVGGVTSQHVGRLRRVSERFGDVSTQYETLHWSHFQACLDWDDAEMWLEGSIQNGWSVSQMRGKRWETVGKTPDEQKAEVAQLVADQESEAQAEEKQAQAAAADQDGPYDSSDAEVNAFNEPSDGPADEMPDFGGEGSDAETAEAISKRTRLSVDVESLPDDLAEAFESFKLAIIAHRRENWRDTTPESVIECLESLKELAMAEADVV